MAKPVIVRLLTLGDSGAGKSSLLLRYTQNEFSTEYMPTIGIDFRLKTLELENRTVKVQVWDTAGQERFRTITHNYYRGAHGIALVYDITNQASFDNIRKWIADVHTYAESNVNLVLIGNKCDLSEKRVVDESAGRALAGEYHIEFYETSAKNDVNVVDAFNSLVHQVVNRLSQGDIEANKKGKEKDLHITSDEPGKKSCC
jgi:Ras-related protein Rab-8A